MGRVVHFEITAKDTKRAKKFYEIFDWKITKTDIENVDYWLANTGEDSRIGINGAIMPTDYADQPSIIWISVDNIDDMIEKVKQAGGEIVGDKQSVPNVGDTIYVKDTEGNRIGLIQARR